MPSARLLIWVLTGAGPSKEISNRGFQEPVLVYDWFSFVEKAGCICECCEYVSQSLHYEPMTYEALDEGIASADIASAAVCAPVVHSDRDDED